MPDGDGRAGGEENCYEAGEGQKKENSDALPMMYARAETDTPCTVWFSDRLCLKTLL